MKRREEEGAKPLHKVNVGSKGKEGMKEDPGFCLVCWMDDGPIDQEGNPIKKSRFGRSLI